MNPSCDLSYGTVCICVHDSDACMVTVCICGQQCPVRGCRPSSRVWGTVDVDVVVVVLLLLLLLLGFVSNNLTGKLPVKLWPRLVRPLVQCKQQFGSLGVLHQPKTLHQLRLLVFCIFRGNVALSHASLGGLASWDFRELPNSTPFQ